MESYKREFIEFMVDSQVLKFGEFTLKSGRKSPFFMNAGGYAVSYTHLDVYKRQVPHHAGGGGAVAGAYHLHR